MNLHLLKTNLLINGFSLFKLPLLAFITPRVVELGDKRSVVKVGLSYRTKNHLGVMYFGALAMGAELSIAAKAIEEIQKSGQRLEFLFKGFSCEFLRRADGDVHFVCDQAEQVTALVQRAANSAERVQQEFEGFAIVPSKSAEPIMRYKLTLTIKNRSLKNC